MCVLDYTKKNEECKTQTAVLENYHLRKKQKTLFDTIHRKNKSATSSTWEGNKGTYFVKSTGKSENRKPVSRV